MQSFGRRTFLGASAALAATSSPLVRANERERVKAIGYAMGDDAVDPKLRDAVSKLRTRFAVNIEMWGFGTNDHVERIRRAAAFGFKAVEMWPYEGKDIDALAKVSKDLGVEIVQFTGWGFSPGLNDPKNHENFQAKLETACGVAKKLDTKMILVVAGNDQKGMTQDQMIQNVIDGLKLGAPIAEKHGITLILEPMNIRVDHPGHCLYGSPNALKICRAVNSPRVKICWDLYHMQISEGDLCGRLKEGFDQIAYFQLADHPGRTEPGTGEVHYGRVFKAAHDLGYRGWWGLECNPSESEEAAVRRVVAADVW